ncbi:hypothetical protein HDU91_000265 [Kappamyces sp. JEL0680]|nr:hypothetical protein HDU91_000265 [Kappamyces sp. JEL0680]
MNPPWILSVRDDDYLSVLNPGRSSIKEKLDDHLKALGFQQEYAHAELVTTPRFFGFSFNPLSLYLIRDSDHVLLAVLLEVNNTFQEKHLYLCHKDTMMAKQKRGYHSYSLQRAFHVSPFNNRTGRYEAHIAASTGHLEIVLNMFGYQTPERTADGQERETVSEAMHFTAKVSGDAHDLNSYSILYLVLFYPFNCLLTLPRIMWEATKLTYQKKLAVYQRPSPFIRHGDGRTIISKPPASLHLYCRSLVLDSVSVALKDSGSQESFVFYFPDNSFAAVPPSTQDVRSSCAIFVRSWNGFTWFIANPTKLVLGFYLAFAKGDFNAAPATVAALVSTLARNRAVGMTARVVDPDCQYHLVIPAGEAFKVFCSRLQILLEFWMFRQSATFVKGGDAWNVQSRCLSYLDGPAGRLRPQPGWNGVDDLPDSLSGLEKEEARALFFLECMPR